MPATLRDTACDLQVGSQRQTITSANHCTAPACPVAGCDRRWENCDRWRIAAPIRVRPLPNPTPADTNASLPLSVAGRTRTYDLALTGVALLLDERPDEAVDAFAQAIALAGTAHLYETAQLSCCKAMLAGGWVTQQRRTPPGRMLFSWPGTLPATRSRLPIPFSGSEPPTCALWTIRGPPR